MDATKQDNQADGSTAGRDLLLRRAIGVFAGASVLALVLAVGTAAWHQSAPRGDESHSLAADSAR